MRVLFFLFLLIFFYTNNLVAHELSLEEKNIKHDYSHYNFNFNNGSVDDYNIASNLSGDTNYIQKQTDGLFPRQENGSKYFIAENKVTIENEDDFLVIKSNNIPDHSLFTNNPNCAAEQSFTFKIPKVPEFLNKPIKISKDIQEVGVALNGVVISGPYDSEGKIAIYNRKIGQCGGHADPRGMYHYHYGPLCGETINMESNQIGWAFDGIKIMNFVDRNVHNKTVIDECNGHNHDGEYHYHSTNSYPSFIGCFKAKPYEANFRQKRASNSVCP